MEFSYSIFRIVIFHNLDSYVIHAKAFIKILHLKCGMYKNQKHLISLANLLINSYHRNKIYSTINTIKQQPPHFSNVLKHNSTHLKYKFTPNNWQQTMGYSQTGQTITKKQHNPNNAQTHHFSPITHRCLDVWDHGHSWYCSAWVVARDGLHWPDAIYN